jgi:PAS domain S-box-containing protein
MHNLELFYMLAEQTTNGIILKDADKRIIYVNKAFTISTGYS